MPAMLAVCPGSTCCRPLGSATFASPSRTISHVWRGSGDDVDAIQAGPQQVDLRVRRVDARGLAGVEHAHAHDDMALRDEQRELAVVQPRDVQVRVATETELAAAVVDLGAAVRAGPQVVAGGDRIVLADAGPLVGAVGRRQVELARQARDAAGARHDVVGRRDVLSHAPECRAPAQARRRPRANGRRAFCVAPCFEGSSAAACKAFGRLATTWRRRRALTPVARPML